MQLIIYSASFFIPLTPTTYAGSVKHILPGEIIQKLNICGHHFSIFLEISFSCIYQFDFLVFVIPTLQNVPSPLAITLFCLSVFSGLFDAQTGNNQAFTGSSRVERGPHTQYTCQRLFYDVRDKNTTIHVRTVDQRAVSDKW